MQRFENTNNLYSLSGSDDNSAKYHKLFRNRVLRKYQRDWLDGALHGNVFILGSRQIGKTYLLSYLAFLLAAGYRDDNIELPPSDVWVISADKSKAQNIIREVNKRICEFEQVVEPVSHRTMGGKQSAVLANGKTITALSGRAASLQGFTGHVIVDELSITSSKPEDILAQAMSVSSSKGWYRMVVCSNADRRGSFIDNFLNGEEEYWRGRRSGFRVYDTTIWDAYPELTDKLIKIRNTISIESWQRFFENRFVSGDAKLFKESQLITAGNPGVGPTDSGSVWISVDPGFSATGNPSGVIVARIASGRIHVIDVQRWWAKPTGDQIEALVKLYRDWGAVSCLVDIGSAGLAIAQGLESRCRVTRVSVSRKTIQEGFDKIRTGLDEGRITFSDSCWALKEDLLSIEVDENGSYIIPQVPHKSGGKLHADTAMALLYIAQNIKNKGENRSPIILNDVQDNIGRWL